MIVEETISTKESWEHSVWESLTNQARAQGSEGFIITAIQGHRNFMPVQITNPTSWKITGQDQL